MSMRVMVEALSLLASIPNTEAKANMVQAVGVEHAALAYKISPEMFRDKKKKKYDPKPWDSKRKRRH